MTPAARVQCAIALLDEIERDARPAHRVVERYLRARRFIGSKDRRAVGDLVFRTVRARIRLDWLIAARGTVPDSRSRVLAALALDTETGPDRAAALFDGGRYGPAPLDADETGLLAALAAADSNDPTMPAAVRGNYPSWLEPALAQRFGPDLAAEMAALDAEAAVDLRVNERRAGRAEVMAALRKAGFDSEPTPWSPLGLRLDRRPGIANLALYRDGTVELQDEGAQLIAFLVDAVGADCVVDYCAGAGGKTLALAARMGVEGAGQGGAKGRLIACDSAADRLKRMGPRLRRAGVARLERQVVAEAADPWVAANPTIADRLLIDIPCTGTGTWRRHPDARARLTPVGLESCLDRQRRILDQAEPLVRPGGRLIYATCSVLKAENEDQVAAFLARRPDFALVPIDEVWRAVLPGDCPAEGPMLQLTPNRHGTDGFFVTILARAS
ncbi:MAG: RsmB/NOP family class I SAM-dependent RNA methyltransferase [Alphaproteobacteria bacterium]|jgi:16S rRNA (cytosine967-C5)-methyltransferase|nr:RsmB/NOP family class I SAM-dependent RNA methyltransferase [Alphaproteobacteria bacterium]MDP6517564.1 RsmB/NOP family class I SAM-dependent RNA methyltransferase [Alphaproteobacteria bacterium]